MVTKGVLKEHLLLLANSMACSGNLIGFTVGGYKALIRSMNIQVPFTEATLYVRTYIEHLFFEFNLMWHI